MDERRQMLGGWILTSCALYGATLFALTAAGCDADPDDEAPQETAEPASADESGSEAGNSSEGDDDDGSNVACDIGDEGYVNVAVTGHPDGGVNWEGSPWQWTCGGFGSFADEEGAFLFYPVGLDDDGLGVSVRLDTSIRSAADGVPVSIAFGRGEELLGFGWATSAGACTADLSRYDLVAPGTYQIEGTATCTGPAEPSILELSALEIEGDIAFSGIVLANNEQFGSVLLECCR